MYWLVYSTPRGVCIVLQAAPSLIHARVKVGMSQLVEGEFTEGHQLDSKTIKRIPKKMIGRKLSAKEATQLLAKF